MPRRLPGLAAALLALLAVLPSMGAQQSNPGPTPPGVLDEQQCQQYFQLISGSLDSCYRELDELTPHNAGLPPSPNSFAGAVGTPKIIKCPRKCTLVFQSIPQDCLYYVERQLNWTGHAHELSPPPSPAGGEHDREAYPSPAAGPLGKNMSLDMCQYFCSNLAPDKCQINVTAIQVFISLCEELKNTSSPMWQDGAWPGGVWPGGSVGGWDRNASAPPPATSSSHVGLIVGTVIAANALIVAVVGGFLLVRHRRKRRHEQQLQLAATKAVHLPGTGRGAGPGGSGPSGSSSGGAGMGTDEDEYPHDLAKLEAGLAASKRYTDSAESRAVYGGIAAAHKPPEGRGPLGLALPVVPSRHGAARVAPLEEPVSSPSATYSSAASGGTASRNPSGLSVRGDLSPLARPPRPASAGDGVQGVAALWADALQNEMEQAGGVGRSDSASEGRGAVAEPATRPSGDPPRRSASDASSAQQEQQQQGAAPPAAQQQQHEQQPSTAGAAAAAGGQPTAGSERGSQDGGPPSAAELAARRSSSAVSMGPRASSALMDLEPWRVEYSGLSLQRVLGEGSFGKVFLAKWNETLVAVKVLVAIDHTAPEAAHASTATRSLPGAVMEALEKEARVMASLRHPNTVLFLGFTTQPPAVITEYCSRGSLLGVLRAARMSPSAAASLSWVRRLSLALDAAKGMLCLHAHQPPILHRDLKSPNLLIDKGYRVKVADYGLSKIMDLDTEHSSTAHGLHNPRWLAPEVLLGESHTAASDVFSFAVIMWELATWAVPWEEEGRNAFQLVHMISGGERLRIPARQDLPGPDTLPEEAYDAYVGLMRRCWAQDPSQRPAFPEIIMDLRQVLSMLVGGSFNGNVASPAADHLEPGPSAAF